MGSATYCTSNTPNTESDLWSGLPRGTNECVDAANLDKDIRSYSIRCIFCLRSRLGRCRCLCLKVFCSVRLVRKVLRVTCSSAVLIYPRSAEVYRWPGKPRPDGVVLSTLRAEVAPPGMTDGMALGPILRSQAHKACGSMGRFGMLTVLIGESDRSKYT